MSDPVTSLDQAQLGKAATAYSGQASQVLDALMRTTVVQLLAADESFDPIAAQPGDGKPAHLRPYATASLFTIAGMHFLITAAHVFDDRPTLFGNNMTAKRAVLITGKTWV